MLNNLTTVFYMLLMLAIVVLCNIGLGTVLENKKHEFNLKKFLSGISKAILIAFCMLLFCVTLELVPEILSRIDINISNDLITLIEVVLITLTAYKKYALDCIEKFKKILGVDENE